MSITDTRTALGNPERVPVPLVLTFGCRNGVQRWLTQENQLIAAMAWQFQRVDLPYGDEQLPFVYPESVIALRTLLTEQCPHLSLYALREYIKTDEFIEQAWMTFSRWASSKLGNGDGATCPLLSDEEISRMRIMIIDEKLLYSGSILLEKVLQPHLPFTNFFEENKNHAVPRLLWRAGEASPTRALPLPPSETEVHAADAPLCKTCGAKTRPAGSAFVCENCGTLAE